MLIAEPNIDLELDKNEIYRYLGYTKEKIPTCDSLLDVCIDLIRKAAMPKACYEVYPVQVKNDGSLDLGFQTVVSKDLSKNLKECTHIILFAATIGIETDRLIAKYSLTEPSKSVVLQAVSAAAIESWCDILCKRFSELDIAKNTSLCPRFSPGYGDLDLHIQSHIFDVLNCRKQIGLTLTESLMMLPSKSVSAIVGIRKRSITNE